jgi:hypothetical protein
VLIWSLNSSVFLDPQLHMLDFKSRTGMPGIQSIYFCAAAGTTFWLRDVSQFQRTNTEMTNQSARQVVSVEVLKAKPKPSQSLILPPQLRQLSRVCAVPVLLGLREKSILAGRGALVVVQSVGRGLVRLIVPAPGEEGLSVVHKGTGTRVRDGCPEVKG